jgi:tRNA threonylcarbamoyl adenosine modification protein YeaZ
MAPDPVKKYLAWDTSSLVGMITAFEVSRGACRKVCSFSLSLETSRHSERLLWSIHQVLEAAGWKIRDLSGIAVGTGPGSFTGLRIGLTTARILAGFVGIPLIPLSSLALLARGVLPSLELLPKADKILVIACTDATKGEWFTLMGSSRMIRDCIAMAEGDLGGIWGRGVVEAVFTPDALIGEIGKRLKKDPGLRWLAVGQSVVRYPEIWKALPKQSRICLSASDSDRIHEDALIRMAFEAISQGLERSPGRVRPRYLRASEAEVKLSKGLLKPAPVHPRGGTG